MVQIIKAHSPNGRWPSRQDRKRLEILEAASQIFRDRGFERTTTRDIANALGLTPGSLYYYFKDKQEIIFFCQETALRRLLTAGRRIGRMPLDPAQKLYLLIAEQVRCMLEDLFGSLAHVELDGLAKRRRSRIVARRHQYELIVRQIIRQGMRRRVFTAGDVRMRTLAILGAVNWTARWYTPDGPAGPAEIGRCFAAYLVSGLMRRSVRARFPRFPIAREMNG
ncbi:MAG: TetR/AcrR family transcriptional regulator [Acidobacteria bacterium]|nr:TetR/AcrR family transcriptional regulator [Acidobacteriota bacterium]